MRAFSLTFAIAFSIFTGILILLCVPALPQESKRGIKIAPKTAAGTLHAMYVKRYGVVVGINQYPNIPKLSAAVNDAKQVASQLKKMGFNEVITLLDEKATRTAIVETLGDYIGEKAQENDLVVFFYAGHGETKGGDTEQMGFILPYDYNPKKHMTTSISMSTLHDISKGIKAKHMLYAMDSCFSGGILKARAGGAPVTPTTSRGTYRYLKNLTESQAHVVITAGGQNEETLEEGGSGIFTRAFIDGLSGKADFGQKGFVTASALALYIQETVQQYLPPGVKQNPQYGRILGEGDVVLAMFRPAQIDPEEERGDPSASRSIEVKEIEEALKKDREKLQREMQKFEEQQARAHAEQELLAAIERGQLRKEMEQLKEESAESKRLCPGIRGLKSGSDRRLLAGRG